MFSNLLTMFRRARQYRHELTLSRSEFAAEKLVKFRALVRHVNIHSPYYARIIQEQQIDLDTCIPQDFPVLTKKILMENWDEIITTRAISKKDIAQFLTHSHDPAELFRNRYTVIHTSGSSGEVGYFIFSPQDLIVGMGLGRPRPRQPRVNTGRKRRWGRFRVAFYGATDGHYAGVTMVSMLSKGIFRLFVKVGIFEVNSPLGEVLDGLNRFQPDLLIGYTTALKNLAAKQLSAELAIAPMHIAASGEATSNHDKRFLEESFGAQVTNGYGCSEHLAMGGSMPGGDDIVLFDNHLIFECKADHALITNLFNYTLPLIRYRMSDTLRPLDTEQHSPYLVIASLVGRNELQPEFCNRDGVMDFLSVHTINEIFVDGVNRFQFHILGDTSFSFKVCLDARLSVSEQADCCEQVRLRLAQILARKHMENVAFTVAPVDDLPVSPITRKFQLIVDARN